MCCLKDLLHLKFKYPFGFSYHGNLSKAVQGFKAEVSQIGKAHHFGIFLPYFSKALKIYYSSGYKKNKLVVKAFIIIKDLSGIM